MKKYENPEMHVVELAVEDVITTSVSVCDTHCGDYSGDDNL